MVDSGRCASLFIYVCGSVEILEVNLVTTEQATWIRWQIPTNLAHGRGELYQRVEGGKAGGSKEDGLCRQGEGQGVRSECWSSDVEHCDKQTALAWALRRTEKNERTKEARISYRLSSYRRRGSMLREARD